MGTCVNWFWGRAGRAILLCGPIWETALATTVTVKPHGEDLEESGDKMTRTVKLRTRK